MISKIFLATCLVGFVFACATAPPRLFLKDLDRYVEAGQIISGATGAPVTFDEMLADLPAVVDAVHLTGPFDTQLRNAATDVGELDELLARLKDDFGVQETNTRLILRTIDGFPRPPQV